MGNILSETRITEVKDAAGNITTKTDEVTRKIERNDEPDYIKLYTRMWCEFNQIPHCWRALFTELICRMSYANSADLEGSQIVVVFGAITKAIMKSLKWKDRSMLTKGLKALCDCKAIKKVDRATYQINPEYAGKGEWRYNPKANRGGVSDLRATFHFAQGSVETEIIWADDGANTEYNDSYRKGVGVTAQQETIIKETKIQLKSA